MEVPSRAPDPMHDPVGWMAKLSVKGFVFTIFGALIAVGAILVLAIGGFEPTASYTGVAIDPSGQQCSTYVYAQTPAFTNWIKLPAPLSGWHVYANQILLEGSNDLGLTTPYGECSVSGTGCCQQLAIAEIPLPAAFVRQSTNTLLIGYLALAAIVFAALILGAVLSWKLISPTSHRPQAR